MNTETTGFRKVLMRIVTEANRPLTADQVLSQVRLYWPLPRSYADTYAQLRALVNLGELRWIPAVSKPDDPRLARGRAYFEAVVPLDLPASLDPEDLEAWLIS